eukprot:gene2558-4994_t
MLTPVLESAVTVLGAGIASHSYYREKDFHQKSMGLSKELHDVEVRIEKQHHKEEMDLSAKQHSVEIEIAKETHIREMNTALESHFQQLNTDLMNATREAERDMYDQRNAEFQTLILCSTVMFTALSTVIIQGQLPLGIDDFVYIFMATVSGFSFALLFLCIVLCTKIVLRSTLFMYRRANNQTKRVYGLIEKTIFLMKHVRDFGKSKNFKKMDKKIQKMHDHVIDSFFRSQEKNLGRSLSFTNNLSEKSKGFSANIFNRPSVLRNLNSATTLIPSSDDTQSPYVLNAQQMINEDSDDTDDNNSQNLEQQQQQQPIRNKIPIIENNNKFKYNNNHNNNNYNNNGNVNSNKNSNTNSNDYKHNGNIYNDIEGGNTNGNGDTTSIPPLFSIKQSSRRPSLKYPPDYYQARPGTFEHFWLHHCERQGRVATWLFYSGTGFMLISVAVYMYAWFSNTYKSQTGAVLAVIFLGLALVTGLSVAYFMEDEPDAKDSHVKLKKNS